MKYLLIIAILINCLLGQSCKKYLNEPYDKSLAIPSTLAEFQQLLDNQVLLTSSMPFLRDLSADEIYLSYSNWQGADVVSRNAYMWADDIYQGATIADWDFPYRAIYYSNLALDGIQNIQISQSNLQDYNTVKANALLYRALAYYNLEETFGQPFNPASADRDLGIPLRLSSDLNDNTQRATVKDVYAQIISDLMMCKPLINTNVNPTLRNRASKPAIFALFARVYFTMQDYQKAAIYADSCLNIYNSLVDYNSLSPSSFIAFSSYANSNAEVLLQGTAVSYAIPVRFPIDTNFYNSFSSNDLRKLMLFRLNPTTFLPEFKGSYTGTFGGFAGLATDEIYLIKSEANARNGNLSQAMDALNSLAKLRYVNGSFIPFTASTSNEALNIILTERKKELLFRGLRWIDLRRLNQDNNRQTTIIRDLNGTKYTLIPKSPRYTLPIPQDIINFSGISQNPR